jgi:transketolase
MKVVPGIECSAGSLGHGLPIGLGMAIAKKKQGLQGRLFVLVGDGELNEGS